VARYAPFLVAKESDPNFTKRMKEFGGMILTDALVGASFVSGSAYLASKGITAEAIGLYFNKLNATFDAGLVATKKAGESVRNRIISQAIKTEKLNATEVTDIILTNKSTTIKTKLLEIKNQTKRAQSEIDTVTTKIKEIEKTVREGDLVNPASKKGLVLNKELKNLQTELKTKEFEVSSLVQANNILKNIDDLSVKASGELISESELRNLSKTVAGRKVVLADSEIAAIRKRNIKLADKLERTFQPGGRIGLRSVDIAKQLEKNLGRPPSTIELLTEMTRGGVSTSDTINIALKTAKMQDAAGFDAIKSIRFGDALNITEFTILSLQQAKAMSVFFKLISRNSFGKFESSVSLADKLMSRIRQIEAIKMGGVGETARTLGSFTKLDRFVKESTLNLGEGADDALRVFDALIKDKLDPEEVLKRIRNPIKETKTNTKTTTTSKRTGIKDVTTQTETTIAKETETEIKEEIARVKVKRSIVKTVEERVQFYEAFKRVLNAEPNDVKLLSLAKVETNTTKLIRMFNSHYIQSLLGAKSSEGNMFSNSANIGTLFLEATLNKVNKNAPSAMDHDLEALASGFLTGFKNSLGSAKKAFKNQDVTIAVYGKQFKDKRKFQVISNAEFKHNLKAVFGDSVYGRGMSNVIFGFHQFKTTGGLGTRALQSGDVQVRGTIMHMMGMREATRDALKKNLTRGTKEYDEFVAARVRDLPPETLEDIYKLSNENLFTKDFIDKNGDPNMAFGRMLDAFEKGLNISIVGKVIAPFVKVAANMTDHTLARLPLIRNLSPEVNRILKTGTQIEKADLENKLNAGLSILMLGATLQQNGMLTGLISYNRETTRSFADNNVYADKNNLRIGDTSVPLSMLASVGNILALGGTINQLTGHVSDEARMDDLVVAMTVSIFDKVTPPLMENVEELMSIINTFGDEKSAGKQALVKLLAKGFGRVGNITAAPISKDLKDLSKFVSGSRESVIPKIDGDSSFATFKNIFLDEFMRDVRAPGFDPDTPQLNNLGDVLGFPPLLGYGYVDGFFTGRERGQFPKTSSELSIKELKMSDKIQEEGERLSFIGVNSIATANSTDAPFVIKPPPQYLTAESVKIQSADGLPSSRKTIYNRLSAKEYAQYIRLAAGFKVEGHQVDMSGIYDNSPTLKEALFNLITSDSYQKATVNQQKISFLKINSMFRSKATKLMKQLLRGSRANTRTKQDIKDDFGDSPIIINTKPDINKKNKLKGLR
jgi:hypothetical protein